MCHNFPLLSRNPRPWMNQKEEQRVDAMELEEEKLRRRLYAMLYVSGTAAVVPRPLPRMALWKMPSGRAAGEERQQGWRRRTFPSIKKNL